MNILGLPGSLREVVQRRLHKPQLLPWNTRPMRDEDTVGLLSEKDSSAPGSTSHRKNVNRKLGFALALFGIVVLLVAVVSSLSTKYARVDERARSLLKATIEDHYLHVVVSAQSSYVELCKTMLTGFVLSYPPPWIAIPKSTSDEDGHEVSPVLRRLESILEFLEHEHGKRDTDTAIILGNPNTWFQVRPEVLLRRYTGIKHRHDLKLLNTFGNETVIAHDLNSRVVFASNTACHSVHVDDCSSVLSASGLPRYLSYDFTVGQIKDLTPLYKHAVVKARVLDASNTTFDEETIFGDFFRHQEYRRQSLATVAVAQSDLELNGPDSRDYGITLDVDSDLSHLLTGDDVGDSTWTKPDAQIYDLRDLSQDIALSTPPYWTVSAALPSKTWKQVPLLVANQRVPAMIQRKPDADPELSHAWYERLWFHPYSRALLDSEVLTSILPLARLVDPRTGTRQRFWAQGIGKASVKTVDVEIYQWSEVCGDAQVAKEVFADGKGVWKDPRL